MVLGVAGDAPGEGRNAVSTGSCQLEKCSRSSGLGSTGGSAGAGGPVPAAEIAGSHGHGPAAEPRRGVLAPTATASYCCCNAKAARYLLGITTLPLRLKAIRRAAVVALCLDSDSPLSLLPSPPAELTLPPGAGPPAQPGPFSWALFSSASSSSSYYYYYH